MRISDWSSDVVYSDLIDPGVLAQVVVDRGGRLLLQLAAELRLDRFLGRRLGHGALLDLDDVPAELGLHRRLGVAADLHGEGGSGELRHHIAGLEGSSEARRVVTECVRTGVSRW